MDKWTSPRENGTCHISANPLYSDGLSHTDNYIKYGSVHYI